MTPRVRAVVLNFNGGAHVIDCVVALRATRWPEGSLEVVVVDNASTDGSDVAVAERFPDVRIVRARENLGFPGNNLALRDLDGVDHVALVNNDAFVDPDWLAPLVAVLDADPRAGAACPKILFARRRNGEAHDTINNAGSILLPLGFGADRGFGEPDIGQYDDPAEVFAWCGGAVLLRADYLRDVGLFDERFFLYYEDTDLSWRGRAQGWRYRYEPRSVVRHLHATSSVVDSPLFQHYVERNRLLVLLKNAPWSLVANAFYRYVRMIASYTLKQGVLAPLRGDRPTFAIPARRLRSLGGVVRHAPAMLRARRQLRRRQVVPDAELVAWTTTR